MIPLQILQSPKFDFLFGNGGMISFSKKRRSPGRNVVKMEKVSRRIGLCHILAGLIPVEMRTVEKWKKASKPLKILGYKGYKDVENSVENVNNSL